ncbi:FtsX-like permease family protein [Flavobacterium sp.]|uniref:FtsX-like permease family protein n=1 Tax=Flavobacterium sp. TaxID=239 RepID=UPI004033D367
MVKNWLKVYLYHVKANKLFSALNVLGISLGIAGLIFAILYWNDEQSYNTWNPGKEHIFFSVSDLGEDKVWGSSSDALGNALSTIPEVKSHCYMSGWYNSNILKSDGKKVMAEKVVDAQATFFEFFPFPFVKGDPKKALSPTSIAISDQLAIKLFGTADVLGREVTYEDKPFTITGVYQITGKSSYMPDMVTNRIDAKLKENENNWGNFRFALFMKLARPEDASSVEKKIEALYLENDTKRNAQNGGISVEEYIKRFGSINVYLEQLKDIRLHTHAGDVPESKGNYQLLLIMVGLSVLILIMSIANYVNLATANAIKRAKEVGVRKVLGASKRDVVTQFVFESMVTTFFAILIALVVVEVSLPYYNEFLRKSLVMESSYFLLQLVGVFIAVVLVAGVFPAAYVSGFKEVQVLRGTIGSSKKGIWLRNAMLVGQFAIASFFIIGSYVVYSQVNHLITKDPGFKADQVISVYYRNPYDFKVPGFKKIVANKYMNIKHRLLAIKGVEMVSANTAGVGEGTSFYTSYGYNGQFYSMQNMVTDYNLLEMLEVEMKEGRTLSPKFAEDTISSVILNEAAVKFMGIKDPMNSYVEWQDGIKFKIIGVTKDFHINGPQEKIMPVIIYHYKTVDWMLQNAHNIYIKIDPQHTEAAIAAIEKLWREEIDPDFPFTYDFINKNFKRTYHSYVQQRNLFSLLNVVVIVIALFGLFALASFNIERRMKEIAIRKTLGAETATLLKELSQQYVVFCIVGFAIAFVPAWLLLDMWLDNFAYRLPVSWLPFAVSFCALMALTLVVVLSKTYAATRVEVLKYLKYE